MIFKTFFTNSFGILISRIFGFVRDLLTASILGANVYSDMFFVAFKLPNLFRRIFAEGAFTNAFLPAFTKSKNKGIFSLHVFVRFFIFILFLTLLVIVFSSYVTKAFAFGFSAEQVSETAPLVSINFLYLVLIYCVTFIASLLNYRGHFATTAFSTALLNIAMIVALLLSDKTKPELTIYYLSFGVVVGG
ncbi:MAG: lipid II flippase MurJ, partial [Campylobacteraceae bacterium]